jgi:hypothetical protein
MKIYHRISEWHLSISFPPSKKKTATSRVSAIKSRRHRGFAVVIVGGVHLHTGIFAWVGGGAEEKNWEIFGLKMVGR